MNLLVRRNTATARGKGSLAGRSRAGRVAMTFYITL
jgi:hypothetical protein